MQHCTKSSETVFDEALWSRLPEADAARLGLVEGVDERVKGVDQPLRLVRTTLTTAGAAVRALS